MEQPVVPSGLARGGNRRDRTTYRPNPAEQQQRGSAAAEFRLTTSRSLAVLAEADMLGIADVAFLAKVPKSTLSRLWHDQRWLDTVSGATLQRLIGAVPGLAAYVEWRSHTVRLESALCLCTQSGLEVRQERLLRMTRAGHGVQHLATVLEAAAAVMRMEPRETVSSLSRCWGLPQSHALDAVFSLSPGALVAQPHLLTAKAMQLIERVETGNAMRPTVGTGILVHKLTRLTGAVPGTVPPAADRGSAFAHRSGIIGMLLSRGDLDAAVVYHRQLQADPLLRRNELWSLVTFGGDIALTPELGSATRTALRRTASEVIDDLATLPDAYLYYLVTTAIPVLLDYDRSFGSSIAELRRAVTQRLDHGVEDTRTRAASLHLIKATT